MMVLSQFKIEELKVPDYERVIYAEEPKTGLKAFVAIHNTNLGPSCGGIRLLPYASKEEAIQDVLRLSKGMSYKSALAGINFGGGKSVIIADPAKKSPELFHKFGEFVNTFGGRYIAAKDMNVSSEDLMEVKKTTAHVLGIEGVPGSSGDPSPVTSYGIVRALHATAEELTGRPSLRGMKIAVQGVGHVGMGIVEMATKEGAEIWVTDIDPTAVQRAVKEHGAKPVSMEEIYDLPVDIFSPCARGAVLNATTVPRLKCKAVVGAANNQLATNDDGLRLMARNILYAPDYAINSGGIINIFIELDGYSKEKAMKKADGIYSTLLEIYRRARTEKAAPFIVADRLAEERLYGAKRT